MKKFLSLFAAIFFAGSMMAADPVTVKSTFTKATAPANDAVTDLEGVVTWSIATEVGVGEPTYATGKSTVECLKFGNSKSEYFSKISFSTNYFKDYNVTSVALYVKNNGSKVGTLTAKQGEVTIGSVANESATNAWNVMTATGTDGEGGTLTVTYEVEQASYISYIEVQYEAAQGGETPATTKTIYCSPFSEWHNDGARFAVYAMGDGENTAWYDLVAVEGAENVYSAEIAESFPAVIFCRMNGATTENNWDNKWNQTADLTLPTDGKNLYTITGWNDNDGTWSVYGDTPVPPVDPEPAEKDSIYFVNVAGWAAPRVHLWGGTAAGTEWPGVEMTKLEDQINNYDVYKYVADKGAYVKCIFSDNGENQTVDLDWTSGKYFYNDAWYALNEIPAPLPDAVPLEGNIWKVTAETPLVAGSHYINEALLKMDGVYATNLKTNTRTIAGEEFTHAIQVRTDGYPTADNKAGKEKSGSTSLIITAKEDADVTFYYNRQVVGEGGTDNDNKDLIVFDQADITTKVAGVFTIDQILEGNNYLNATKKVVLKKDHIYTVTASGTTLQLHGIKLEAHTPVMQIAGAWNVQDEAWLLNDMNLAEDKLTATYEVELTPGDYEFKMIKDGAWLTKANEGQAYGLHREWPGVAGVIDDATENLKVTADVAGNYVFTWTFANDSIGIAFPEALAEAPSAAPEAPTYEGYQVKAVYSATYNADCSFGEWSSGTQYAQEEFGKKYVTTDMGYFGLEFTGKDCSEMEALHLDIWAASDISLRVVPIHGGTEVGVTVQAQGQQWNAIDIPLANFEGVTNWSNVYQIKIDNASNLTFWLNNVYFYTTQTKTVDLTDGYYLLGNMNGWDIHNLTADHMFIPNNEVEYKLHYTLAEGNEFKVVAVANNELGDWYPNEAGNYVVDFAHVGEKDIYFRPDYQGGEGWHAGCIYVAAEENANPWETWFASGDTWNPETESYLEWDGENQKATIHINVDKNGQWRAQVKYHGPVAEAGKCYRVALKMKSNHAINNVTVKYQDNAEMLYVTDAALGENVEFVFDQTVAGVANGNGIMVLDFGFAKAGDIIEIYDVVIEEAECPQIEHTYTVAGGSDVAFGTAWDPANTANDMVKLEDGSYKWEKTELELVAGNIEFKVCEDHAWTTAYPAQNYKLAISETGIYTITITFNPDNKEVAAVATKTGDAEIDPTVSAKGSWDEWANELAFVLSDDKATATLTVNNVAAGTYEFKVILNGSDWRSNSHVFTRGAASSEGITGNDKDNMKLVADVEGEYAFTWTFATNSLAIEFPEGGEPATGCDWDNIDFLSGPAEYANQFKVCVGDPAPASVVNIQQPGWAAELGIYISLPAAPISSVSLDEGKYAIDGAGVVLYCSAFTAEYTDVEIVANNVTYAIAVYNAKAVTPVDPQYGLLVEGEFVLGIKNTEYTGEGEEWVVTTDLVAGNKFQNYENTTSAAWLVALDQNEGNYTNFGVEDGFYVVNETGNYTFYIKLIYENDNMWVVKNGATAISNTAADAEAVKILNNGMLLIRKGDKTYTIMGQAVK